MGLGLLLILGIPCLLACQPRKNPTPPVPPPQATAIPAQAQGQANPPPVKMSPGPRPQGESKPGKPPALGPVLSAELVGERAFGLLAPPGPIFPADALLGPLEDLNSQDGKTKALLAPIRTFLNALVAGKIDPEPISPSRLDLIDLAAWEVLEGPRPGAWRLGKPKVAELGGEATALAAFSLSWPAGEGKKPIWVKGELGLREEGRAWKVESLSLDPLPLPTGKEG